MKLGIGDKIDGLKIMEIVCRCKHSKEQHKDIISPGEMKLEETQYVADIVRKENMGECLVTECGCIKYNPILYLMEDGTTINDWDWFKCNQCGKNYTRNSKFYYGTVGLNYVEICKICGNIWRPEAILALEQAIERVSNLLGELKNLNKQYSINSLLNTKVERYCDYDTCICVYDLLNSIIAKHTFIKDELEQL